MTKVLGVVLLLVAGVVFLPLSAAFLDDQGSENWILPVDVALVAVFGGVLGAALPGFVSGSTRRRVVVGAAYGVAAAAVGVLVFFLLLSGFDGA
jgi:hypothetical protein